MAVQPSRSLLIEIVKNAVSEEELREAVVYIIPGIAAGELVVINRKETAIQTPSLLLFIDLEPRANWSHKCRYIIVGSDGKVQSEIEGQYPPDADKLQLLSKSGSVEDWMLLTDKVFDPS